MRFAMSCAAVVPGASYRTTFRPGRSRLIGAADEPALQAQLRAYPMASLANHCQHWETAHGVPVRPATMCRAIQGLGWTRQDQSTERQL